MMQLLRQQCFIVVTNNLSSLGFSATAPILAVRLCPNFCGKISSLIGKTFAVSISNVTAATKGIPALRQLVSDLSGDFSPPSLQSSAPTFAVRYHILSVKLFAVSISNVTPVTESLGSTKQETSSTIMMQLLRQQCFIVVTNHQRMSARNSPA